MRYLGLDLGSKTLGMALSDATGVIASSYKVIRHNEEYEKLVDEIEQVVAEKQIDRIVLGLPKNMDNTLGYKGELSMEFQNKLKERLDCEIFLQDERLTTKQAEDMLIMNHTRRDKRKKVIDKLAATIILQSFLDKENQS